MSEMMTVTVKFGSEAIESALRSLWGEASVEMSAQVRRRMVNMIIVVADSKGADAVCNVIHQVAQRYPGRYIIVVLNPDPTALAQWENNTAVCQVAVGNSGGMSYERIVIPYAPGQAKDVPKCLRSILQQELPVVLWWRYIFNPKERIFEELSSMAERTIIDSVTLKSPSAGMERILEISRGKTVVRDINWERIKPWRLALAGLYDVKSYSPFLSRLTEIRIEYNHQLSRQNAVNNSQVLLLFGWLASRLRWRPVSALIEDIPDCRYTLQLEYQGCQLICSFVVFPAISHLQAGLKSISLITAGDPPGSFSVCRCDDSKHIKTQLKLEGVSAAEKVTCLEVGEEADLIANELLSASNDAVYQEALQFLKSYAEFWPKVAIPDIMQ